MKNAHTPGPWHSASKSETTWNIGVYTDSGEEVAHIAVKSALVAQRRNADARLIAAAPELLKALQRLTHPMADDEDVENAFSVIAKATGA